MCDASGNRADIYIDNISVTASTSVTSGPIKQVDIRETGEKLTGIADDEFDIYPNPAQDVLYIVSEEEEEVKIFIYNTSVQIVQHVELKAGSEMIDISKLDDGLYLINIKAEDEVFTKKIIKK